MDKETPEISPSHRYLREDVKEAQKKEMRDWFIERYKDPIECCPHESAEGGYQWIWGGPFRAQEILESEFSDVFSSEIIEELVKELNKECLQWSGNPDRESYDETFFDYLAFSTKAGDNFDNNLIKIDSFLRSKDSQDEDSEFLYRLLFIQVITILEAYLSDLFISTVSKDQNLMRRFIETCNDFRGEKFYLSEVYKVVQEIEKRAKGNLVEMVWHNLHKVGKIYKDTLGIEFDHGLVEKLMGEIHTRHDLVHRNGKTKDGKEVIVTEPMLNELIETVRQFATKIDGQMELSN